MIDFSKLSQPESAAKRLEAEQARRAQDIADDTARRRERCRKSVTITLADDAECRFTMAGDQTAHLHGLQPNGRGVHATWYAPDHLTREEFNAIVNALVPGATFKLDGYWKPFTTASRTSFSFIAQFITAVAADTMQITAKISAFN